MPTITQKELDKLKRGQGVYSRIREPIPSKLLRDTLTGVIETVFREYVNKRRPTKEMEELEWQRFRKILLRHL